MITKYPLNELVSAKPINHVIFNDYELLTAVFKSPGSPDIQDKTFSWPVKVIGNGSATGPEWDYLISGNYVLQYNEGAGATTGFCIASHFQVAA